MNNLAESKLSLLTTHAPLWFGLSLHFFTLFPAILSLALFQHLQLPCLSRERNKHLSDEFGVYSFISSVLLHQCVTLTFMFFFSQTKKNTPINHIMKQPHFQKSISGLYAHQQTMRVSISLYPHQHYSFYVFINLIAVTLFLIFLNKCCSNG